MSFSISKISLNRANLIRASIWVGAIAVLFAIYTFGIGNNPPGFYIDESGLSYNAYLVAKTGAGEFGSRFPLFFQLYTGPYTQYSNPTQIYLLAATFWLFGPGILVARLAAAFSMFTACLLMGLLGARLSGRRAIGIIVALAALMTPWFFEVGRLAMETFFYPMAVVLLLWALYLAHRKREWRWFHILAIVAGLTLVTYSYTIGRVFGPLLAFGLISFAVNRRQLLAVLITWVCYVLTLVPLIIFSQNNPGLTSRFYMLSYVKPDSTYGEIISKFIPRYFEDLNPVKMLFTGDLNQRHHIPDALGSFFIGVFVLSMIGLVIVIVRKYRDAWWRFAAFGLAASAVPGALTVDAFHSLRMIALPVFLIILTVPTLEWLLGERKVEHTPDATGIPVEPPGNGRPFAIPRQIRRAFLVVVLALTAVEASYFHWKYYTRGPDRGYVFDVDYKPAYDAAVAQPDRPIYLTDAYIHSFWYAVVEGRDTREFVHLPDWQPPPKGAVVIGSICTNCEIIKKSGVFNLYRSK